MTDSKYVELVDARLTKTQTDNAVLIEVSTYPSMDKVKIWFPRSKIIIHDDTGCIEISRWIEKKKNEEEKVLVDSGECLCTL